MLAYIMHGEKQELLLHEDYVTLRLRGGSPACCCCWKLTTSTDDYSILLQDIYFIETGHEAKTSLIINAATCCIIGTCVAVFIFLYAAASERLENEDGVYLLGGVDAAHERARRESLYTLLSEEVSLSFLPLLIVVLLAAANRLRRPYVHLGCLPGGGQNGRKNSLGGGSPFHITLKKGASIEEARDLADWVRGAAAKARQDDISRVRKSVANIGRHARADKLSAHIETSKRLGLTHQNVGSGRVEETTTTSDVLTGHIASEAEMATVVGLTELAGSSAFTISWFLRVLENMAVLALIVQVVLPEVEFVTCKHVYWCSWAPNLME
jgi:hypothetical protein